MEGFCRKGANEMSTVIFFIMVGVLSIYGLCEGIVRFVAWLWIPRDMKAVTFIRCEDADALTPFVEELWQEKEGHPVRFWSKEKPCEDTQRISLSNVEEILLFLSE